MLLPDLRVVEMATRPPAPRALKEDRCRLFCGGKDTQCVATKKAGLAERIQVTRERLQRIGGASEPNMRDEAVHPHNECGARRDRPVSANSASSRLERTPHTLRAVCRTSTTVA